MDCSDLCWFLYVVYVDYWGFWRQSMLCGNVGQHRAGNWFYMRALLPTVCKVIPSQLLLENYILNTAVLFKTSFSCYSILIKVMVISVIFSPSQMKFTTFSLLRTWVVGVPPLPEVRKLRAWIFNDHRQDQVITSVDHQPPFQVLGGFFQTSVKLQSCVNTSSVHQMWQRLRGYTPLWFYLYVHETLVAFLFQPQFWYFKNMWTIFCTFKIHIGHW